MSAVLPGGPPAPAGEPVDPPPGDRPAGSSTASGTGRPAGRWTAPVRVPLQVLGRTLGKAWHDRILGLSAEAAFWQVLSIPPLLIGLLGSLGYLGSWIGADSVTQIEDRLLDASANALTPDVVDSLVRPTLNEILGSGRLDVVSLGFLLTLWAGSSATATFMNTTVIAYGQRDVRGPIATRFMALWLFVVGLLLAVLSLPLLVLGPDLLVALFPAEWQGTAALLVNAVYGPVVLIGLVLGLTSFYHVVLPRRLPWIRHLPGTLLAMTFFVVAATLLRIYVADILVAALPYGALATPIAVLLFCFFFGMAILLGAELNAAVQERWPAPLRHYERHTHRRRAARRARVERRAQGDRHTRDEPSPHGNRQAPHDWAPPDQRPPDGMPGAAAPRGERPQPAERTAPVQPTAPVERTPPVERTAPAEWTPPVEGTAPAQWTAPVDSSAPAERPGPP